MNQSVQQCDEKSSSGNRLENSEQLNVAQNAPTHGQLAAPFLPDGEPDGVFFQRIQRDASERDSGDAALAIAKATIRGLEQDLATLRNKSASRFINRQLRNVQKLLLPQDSRRYHLYLSLKARWAMRNAADVKQIAAPQATAASRFSYFELVKDSVAEDSRALSLMVLSAVHRSGSTLVQRLCNARKGTLLWGEHDGVLSGFAEVYARMECTSMTMENTRKKFFESGEDPNQWIANMTPDPQHVQTAIVRSVRELLNSLYSQYRDTHDVVGFKETRYGRFEIELLRRCYPKADIILLVRDPYKTWNSTPRDWYGSLENWTETWRRNTTEHLALAAADERCHLIRYEDILKREPKTLKRFLAVTKITAEQFEDVMAHKIGSMHFGVSDEERDFIRQRCREPMEALGYA